MVDDLEMMRSSEMERKKMKRLQLIAMIPLLCAVCGPLSLAAGAVSSLLMLAMLALLALCMMGTPFGLVIGPLVLSLRKDLYVCKEDLPLAKRVKLFAILDIAFGVLSVLIMLGLFLLSAQV